MTVLIFFIVLFVLVLVHEWGHFIAAKKTGMRVDEFGIGFPPKVFGVKRGETEYSFNALPIGGFVRIYGENAEDAAADASSGSDISRSFTAKSKWAQTIVLIAGVTMNVLFAWFLFMIAFMVGIPTAVEEQTAGPDAYLAVASVLPNSPAATAGLTPGMQIVGLSRGEESITSVTPSSFSEFTKTSFEPVTVYVAGDDGEVPIIITPVGDIVPDAPETPAIGVSLALIETQSQPFLAAIVNATKTTINSIVAIVVGITTLLVGAFTGTADFSQVAGPVGIVGLVGDAAEFGLTSLLMFTAIISLNLAVINLLPFPALDGGRLLFVAIEALRRKAINPVWVARVNAVGFVLLLLLMVAVTWNDIAKLL